MQACNYGKYSFKFKFLKTKSLVKYCRSGFYLDLPVHLREIDHFGNLI